MIQSVSFTNTGVFYPVIQKTHFSVLFPVKDESVLNLYDTLMSSVLFLTFLLLEFKLSLFFGFSLLAGSLLAFKLAFFILLLECLLRLGADARFFELLLRVSLTAFRVIRLLLDLSSDRRAESQVIEIF